MEQALRAFWLAAQFLTRLPVPQPAVVTSEDLGRSMAAFPAVGLLVGVCLALLHGILGGADAILEAALLLAAWVVVTGNLHLDGLADTADAWVGGQGDVQRTLEIMKDPRSGPAAVTATVLVLVVKFAALAALLNQGQWGALLLAPMLGRAAALALFLNLPYVRGEGLGRPFVDHLPRGIAQQVLVGTALAALLAGGHGVVALIAGGAAWLGLRRAWMVRLGGTTGDTAGATVEIVETAVLVAIALVGN